MSRAQHVAVLSAWELPALGRLFKQVGPTLTYLHALCSQHMGSWEDGGELSGKHQYCWVLHGPLGVQGGSLLDLPPSSSATVNP